MTSEVIENSPQSAFTTRMIVNTHLLQSDFTQALKHWRKHRKMSQLDLALVADVSQRHVSWLETGRSQPSRDMVLRLVEALEVPLRDRNHILNSAGFTSIYSEKKLDEPDMSPILNVLTEMLAHHEPFPAIVIDRLWNIKMKNRAAGVLFSLSGNEDDIWNAIGDNGEKNLALLTVHPQGLRQYISNFDSIACSFIRRLKREAIETGDPQVLAKFQELAVHLDEFEEATASPLLPILPLEIDLGGTKLSLFSVISTFGTPQDITTDELRIETFYPTDQATAKFFRQ